eukprot:2344573-Heterocapsa_arctica.AAC.1
MSHADATAGWPPPVAAEARPSVRKPTIGINTSMGINKFNNLYIKIVLGSSFVGERVVGESPRYHHRMRNDILSQN